MDHLFICINSDSKVENISEISAIRTDGKIGHINQKSIIDTFTSRVNINNVDNVILSLKDKLSATDEKFIVVSFNCEVIRQLISLQCKHELYSKRVWIDVRQIAWPLVLSGLVNDRTIKTLCKYLKIETKENPDSADDCTLIMQIYCRLMQRYKTSLIGEETIREVGGETLESLRKLVGF